MRDERLLDCLIEKFMRETGREWQFPYLVRGRERRGVGLMGWGGELYQYQMRERFATAWARGREREGEAEILTVGFRMDGKIDIPLNISKIIYLGQNRVLSLKMFLFKMSFCSKFDPILEKQKGKDRRCS